jgi:hypothetical protein
MLAPKSSRAKYPLATISAYGPDNTRATKLVVGILRRAGQKYPKTLFIRTRSAGVAGHARGATRTHVPKTATLIQRFTRAAELD